jgi:hypothetical protein
MHSQVSIDWSQSETADHWPLKSAPETWCGKVYRYLAEAGSTGRTQVELYHWGLSHGCTAVLERLRDCRAQLRSRGQTIEVYRKMADGKASNTFLYCLSVFEPHTREGTWKLVR